MTFKGQSQANFGGIYRKGAEVGHMLLLNINIHMESPTAPSDLTLKGQSKVHSDFEGLYLIKGTS